MEISQDQVDELEVLLARMEEVDPALLPPPATELADLLNRILDQLEAG